MLHISIQVNDLVSHDIMTTDRSNLVVSDLTAGCNMLNMFTVQETLIFTGLFQLCGRKPTASLAIYTSKFPLLQRREAISKRTERGPQ